MAAILIVLATYLVLAIGRLPGFRVDRTGACIIGASLMIGFGVLDFEQAYAAINYDTIILLFGMIIIMAAQITPTEVSSTRDGLTRSRRWL